MKKILINLLILVLIPTIVLADESDNTDIDSTTTTTLSNITKSPDTGVEDYFLTLGIVSLVLAGTLYIINKKNVFAEI